MSAARGASTDVPLFQSTHFSSGHWQPRGRALGRREWFAHVKPERGHIVIDCGFAA
ncbi:MAG: hypothetical protein V4617_02075 [Gemmatimonadota bacterium]